MFIPVENRLGIQPIGVSSTVQNHDLGTLIRARDQVYGEGEFIYLLGVVGTVVGSVVIWEGQSSAVPTYQTLLAPAASNLGQPLAVSMTANVAKQYGWYQIGGQAVCQTNGTLAAGNVPVYLAGNGQLTSTSATGMRVLDAISITSSGTPSSGLAIVEIDRPFAQAVDQSGARTQRSITGAGDLPIRPGDSILNIDIAAPLSIPVPLYPTRNGAPITFKNRATSTANATLNRTGSNSFDTLTSIVLVPSQSVTLMPDNDGVNAAGYSIE